MRSALQTSRPPLIGPFLHARGRFKLDFGYEELLCVACDHRRKGGRADERATTQSEKRGHPGVGRGALLQQRAIYRGARLPRRRVHLLRAQGQGERRGALHLRDGRRSEDSRRRSRRPGSPSRRASKLDGIGSPTPERHRRLTKASTERRGFGVRRPQSSYISCDIWSTLRSACACISPSAPVSSVIWLDISSALRSLCRCGSPPEPVSSVTLCARSSSACAGSMGMWSCRGMSCIIRPALASSSVTPLV